MSSIAVVIPTYRARSSILSVISRIGPEVSKVYVVDDCCPERTGDHVAQHCTDPRVAVLYNEINQGVGGATLVGYRAAATEGATVIVKIDADGQMDPALIPFFVGPIISGYADYTKGNRFFNALSIGQMPRRRIFGNAALSIMTKFSTGYWNIFDPTNGYTAIHGCLVPFLPAERVARRFFFETDILFYLGILRAVVIDIPMVAHYGNEKSNLSIKSIALPFLWGHVVRFWRRLVLNYIVRDFSFASICICVGMPLLLFGVTYGIVNWVSHMMQGAPTPTGTIMVATVSVLLGIQLVLFFFSADVAATPRQPLHLLLLQRTIWPLQQYETGHESSVLDTADHERQGRE